MRRTLLCACLSTALAAPGCKQSASTTQEVPAGQQLASGDQLNGTVLARSTSGPWELRGAAGRVEELAPRPKSKAVAPSGPAGARGGEGGGDSYAIPREEVRRAVRREGSERLLGSIGGGGGGSIDDVLKGADAPTRPSPSAMATGGAPPPPPAAPAAKVALAPGKPMEADKKGAPEPAEEEAKRPAQPEDSMAPAPVVAVPEAPRRPQFAALRAGSTDDNAEFGEFVKFLASWSDRSETAGKADLLDVRDRRLVRVVDEQGRRVPTAQVTVVDQAKDKVIWAGTTYGDGQTPFYPRVAAGAGKYTVEAVADGKRGRATWDGSGDVVVPLGGARSLGQTIQLDVLFAIDTTGSMQDEIDRIKGSLLNVTDRLKGLKQEFDLRYSAVLFKDLGDDYLTSTYPFTSDIQAFAGALQQVNASGGGDIPESVNQALAEAVRAPWRPGAAKIVFLIGDAAPHMDYQGDVPYGQSIKHAVAKGVRIHSVAASGLDPLGTLVWRQVAQFTRGRFIFIEYGSAAASAESHGVTGAVKSNNLDDIVFEQIRDELAYWGKDGPAPNVAVQ